MTLPFKRVEPIAAFKVKKDMKQRAVVKYLLTLA
jgi:hypothetical protein